MYTLYNVYNNVYIILTNSSNLTEILVNFKHLFNFLDFFTSTEIIKQDKLEIDLFFKCFIPLSVTLKK